jgi:thymidylate synthase (FAD)
MPEHPGEWTFEQHVAIGKSMNLIHESRMAYNALIKAGIAAETARMVLPLCTPTTMYMSGSIRSWIHYVQLRTQEDTQLEHREIAESIKALMVEHLPITMGVLG